MSSKKSSDNRYHSSFIKAQKHNLLRKKYENIKCRFKTVRLIKVFKNISNESEILHKQFHAKIFLSLIAPEILTIHCLHNPWNSQI